jgi:hypothetical protein
MADDWTDKEPDAPGWYATLYGWDFEEGFFTGRHYWDGKQWSDIRLPIFMWSPHKFDTADEAMKWASEHED